ncbi:MAG: sulfatase/phosphatase domain-containing protein, partial [Bacteroidales bacterium]
DNGPWISYGNHAGTTPFREAKGTSFDGGVRSACLIKYPPAIPAGTVSERMFASIDLLPTLCGLAGIPLPDNEIDGLDVWDLVIGKKGAMNPHDYYAFSNNRNFEGVMSGDGRWKLHLPHPYRTLEYPGKDGFPGKYKIVHIDTAMYDMVEDPMEVANVMDSYPAMKDSMLRFAESHRQRFYHEQADTNK